MVTNVMLVYHLARHEKKITNSRKTNSRGSLSVLVLTITTAFIVLCMANTIANGFFAEDLFETRLGTIIYPR